MKKVVKRVKLFLRFLNSKGDYFIVDEESIPKTFFHRLLTLSRKFNKEGLLVLPKAAYLLSRIRTKKDNLEEIMKVKEAIMTTNNNEWKITEISTLLTLMLMRRGGE
jgi:CRISPR-associated protein Csm1